MTIEAVTKFVDKGETTRAGFRKLLIDRQINRLHIAVLNRDLDQEDVNAIAAALMNTGDFPHFCAEITRYIDRRYRGVGADDNLPISV